jgi:hypothetical protein
MVRKMIASRFSRSASSTTRFRTDRGVRHRGRRCVNFDVYPGETHRHRRRIGLRQDRHQQVDHAAAARAAPASSTANRAEILFGGTQPRHRVPESRCARVRGDKIAMIFQEPMTSLNPVFTVGWQLDEALRYHTKLNKKQRREAGHRDAQLVEIPNPEQRYQGIPAPALGRHAAARHDRHRALLRARHPDRRRAHDRPRRDDPGPDPSRS